MRDAATSFVQQIWWVIIVVILIAIGLGVALHPGVGGVFFGLSLVVFIYFAVMRRGEY